MVWEESGNTRAALRGWVSVRAVSVGAESVTLTNYSDENKRKGMVSKCKLQTDSCFGPNWASSVQ